MAIANGLSLPNPLSNGTTNDAVPLMADLNYVLSALNRALLDVGGVSGMNAQATQIHNLANGTSANDAINLSQISGAFLPIGGGTLTGGLLGTTLSLSSTLAVTGAATLAALTASGLITGNAGFSGTTLSLSGTATLAGITATTLSLSSTLAVTGAATLAALTASGLITGNAGFSGTTLALSGLATLSGGLSCAGALTTGALANSIGYLGAPQNLQTANYTLVLGDIGKSVDMNGASLTLTIPANSSVAFPVGTVVVGTNLNASNLTIAITTDTLTLSGTTTTGPRTVAQNGEFRLKKATATSWLISGTGTS